MTLANLIELEMVTPKNWPNIGIYKVGLHIMQALFSFLAFCVLTTVISAEKAYLGMSQAAPNYDLAVSIISLLVALVLVFSPMSQYQLECFQGVKDFFLKPRTDLVLNCFFTLAWFVAMISMTVHSTSSESCALNTNIVKEDTDYASSWGAQCNCSKAAAAFSWFLFFFWTGSTIFSIILFCNEIQLKKARRDSPTDNEKDSEIPSSDTYDADTLIIKDISYSEKDKKPIAYYNNDSSATVVENGLYDYDRSIYQRTASVSPTINENQFSSPYIGSRPYEYTAASPPYVPDHLSTPPHVPRHVSSTPYMSSTVDSPHYQQPSVGTAYNQHHNIGISAQQPTYIQNAESPYVTQSYAPSYLQNNNVRSSFIPAYNSPTPPMSYDPQSYPSYH